MKFLFILLLFVFSCDDDNPVAPAIDLCGVAGGNDINQDGYHCGDLQVLQDFIDANESLDGQNPLDIGDLQQWDESGRLIFLSLGSEGLTNIPETIGNLSSLLTLGLHNNQLTTIPESFGSLTNLEEFHFRYNQLTNIPESFIELSNLKFVYFENNQLASIPENIGDLTNLIELMLHNNELIYIPESICNLSSNYLLVYNNHLCEEYHYDCVTFGTQDQSNCCEGPNGEPNWTNDCD